MRSRREFLKFVLVGGTAVLVHPGRLYTASRFLPEFHPIERKTKSALVGGPGEPALMSADDPWQTLPQILSRIKPPVFPAREFDIIKFGAAPDGKTDSTDAILKAIAACNASGGGRVMVPQGEFISGAIRLKSNVNLHLASGATLRFTRDARKYPLVFTRWEGVELMNYSPLIYAFEEENVAITGRGTVDGNADCDDWWEWKGRANCGWRTGEPNQDHDRQLLFRMAEENVPVEQRVFGAGHYLRPQFIQPYRCKNVLIEGLTLKNSPMWQVHPVLCSNVTVRKMTITGASANRDSGPNTDGCDPESCTDVLIEGCEFNTGDDCIAIKSGRNADGRRVNVPSQNIVIRGCRMKDGHGGVTIGSEISGGVRNIFAENCQMDSPHLDNAVRIKNNAMRGGVLENIYVRNIKVGQVATAGLSIDFHYEEGDSGKFTPVVRNVELRNLSTQKAQYALYLRGFKNAPITGVRLVDCDLRGIEKPSVIENVQNLDLRNVRINGKLSEGNEPGAMLQVVPEMEFA